MIELTLPWPPSVNAMWRSVVINRAPRVLLSKEGRTYRDDVARIVLRGMTPCLHGRLHVAIEATPPDNRRRDLDNVLKGPLDALKHAGVYEDDSQIDGLMVNRCASDGVGALHVRIREIA